MSKKKDMDRYLGIIKDFAKQRILVVGDIMIDEYIWGDASRISPEAPVPVVNVKNRTYHPGGAANTVANILSLGAGASLLGITGRDADGRRLRAILAQAGIDTKHLITDSSRPTTSKVRIIAHGQQVMRADQEETGPVGPGITKKMIECVDSLMKKIDGIAVSDYNKGVVTAPLMKHIITSAREAGKVITADIKPPNMHMFKGVTVITPNRSEASQITGMKISGPDSLRAAGFRIKEVMGTEFVLITLGEDGLALFGPEGAMKHIPAVSTQVYDVTGAGDTVLSALTVALSAGHNFHDSAVIANFAAGIVVRKRGTATATRQELSEFVRAYLS